jgi:hypothetical protein
MYCFSACCCTLIGVLPGTDLRTIAMLLPVTFSLSPISVDHARRHLLWRAIRRLDHGHPG